MVQISWLASVIITVGMVPNAASTSSKEKISGEPQFCLVKGLVEVRSYNSRKAKVIK